MRLAWDLNFYTQDYKHLWSVRIDAVDAKLLDKQDWVISCNFGDANHKDHNHNFFFNKLAFKQTETTLLDIQSGAYRVFPAAPCDNGKWRRGSGACAYVDDIHL